MINENIPEGFKKCHDCGELLPKTEEYFLRYFSKKDNRYYFKCHCKECGKIRSKAWRENNQERYKKYYSEKNKSAQGRESDKKYKASHRELIKQRKKTYRENNAEKIKEYDKRRRENPETLEHINAMTRRWRANNKAAVSAYNSQYSKANADYFRAAAQKRRAKKKEAENSLTSSQWQRAKAYFNNCCVYCGRKMERLEQEHLIPLSKGGAYAAYNIVPACKSCNSKKHDKEFTEWYRKQPFYSEDRERAIIRYIETVKGGLMFGA